MNCVYKYVNNNVILYIGKTNNLKRRIAEHAKEQNFQNINYQIYYFKCANSVEMDAYEYFLINKYHPKYNIALNNKDIHIQSLIEPEWKIYNYTPKTFDTKETNNIPNYNKDDYLSIKDAAKLKQVSVQAYYKRIKAGTVPMVLIDGKQYIPKKFVLEELGIHNDYNEANKNNQNNNIICFLLDALENYQSGAKQKYIQLIQRYFGVTIDE